MEKIVSKLDGIKVTAFPLIDRPNDSHKVELMSILNKIGDERWSKGVKIVSEIAARQASTVDEIKKRKDDKNVAKKINLPVVCFNGVFSKRELSGLVQHNGLMILDYDGFEDDVQLYGFIDDLKSNKFILAMFMSPSLTGVKAIVKIPVLETEESDRYQDFYGGFQQEFENEHWDNSSSDISRACYVSSDPNIYINEDSEIFDTEYVEDEVIDNVTEVIDYQEDNLGEAERYERIKKFDCKYSYTDGERNDFIKSISAWCCEYGVSKENALRWIIADFVHNPKEVYQNEQRIKARYKSPKISFDSKTFRFESNVAMVRSQEVAVKEEGILKFNFDDYDVSKAGKSLIPHTELIKIIAKHYAFMRGLGYFFPMDSNESIDFSKPIDSTFFVAAIRDLGGLTKADVEAALGSKKIRVISAVEIMHQYLKQNPWDGTDRVTDFITSMSLKGNPEQVNRLIHKFLKMSLAFSIRDCEDHLEDIDVNHRICLAIVSQQKGWGKTTAMRKLGMRGLIAKMIRQVSGEKMNVDLYTELQSSLPKDATTKSVIATNGLFVNLDDVDTALLNSGGEMRSWISSDTITTRPLYSNTVEKISRTATYVITSNNENLLRDKTEDRYLVFKMAKPTDQALMNSIDIMQLWCQLYSEILSSTDPNEFTFTTEDRQEVQALSQGFLWTSGFEDWIQGSYIYNDKAETTWAQVLNQVREVSNGAYRGISDKDIQKALDNGLSDGQSLKRSVRKQDGGERRQVTFWNFDYVGYQQGSSELSSQNVGYREDLPFY